MIQRIQTIYLFLSALAFAGLFVADFATSSAVSAGILSDGVISLDDNPLIPVVAVLGGLLAITCVFLFRNRPLQLKMTMAVILLHAVLEALAAYLVLQAGGAGCTYSFGLVLPLFGIFFAVMALVFIRRDEKTVRSMDRLR